MTESIGTTLKQRREARHLSIEQVAEQTRIRAHYLQALENDDLSAIPSMPQARGFLRNYAEFLGLNLDELSSAPRSIESQEPMAQAASPAEPLPASVSSDEPAPESQPRPGFFGGLRDRFTRRSSSEPIAPEPELIVSSEPEPEVFVPVRTHEELPAAPDETSASEPEPVVEPEVAKPARVRKSSPSSKKVSAKKPVRTTAKKKAVKATQLSKTKPRVKKKIKKLPSRKINSPQKKTLSKRKLRPKRVSSPRKLSFSRPLRRLTKPSRKSAKPAPQTKSRKPNRPLPKKSRK